MTVSTKSHGGRTGVLTSFSGWRIHDDAPLIQLTVQNNLASSGPQYAPNIPVPRQISLNCIGIFNMSMRVTIFSPPVLVAFSPNLQAVSLPRTTILHQFTRQLYLKSIRAAYSRNDYLPPLGQHPDEYKLTHMIKVCSFPLKPPTSIQFLSVSGPLATPR